MKISTKPILLTLCTGAIFAWLGCSQESGTGVTHTLSDLRVTPMQLRHCAEEAEDCFANAESEAECISAASTCLFGDSEAAEVIAECALSEPEDEHAFLECIGFAPECYDDLEAFVYALEAGEPAEIDLDACMKSTYDQCEAAEAACAEDCGEPAHEMECLAESLICDGVPESCAYEYAECVLYTSNIMPAPPGAVPGHDGEPAYPEGEPMHCEEILDACDCDLPPVPVCPLEYEVQEDGFDVDECLTCFCDENGIVCDEVPGCVPTPEPPSPCDDIELSEDCECVGWGEIICIGEEPTPEPEPELCDPDLVPADCHCDEGGEVVCDYPEPSMF